MEGNFIYICIMIGIVVLGLRTRFLLIRQREQYEFRERMAKEALETRLQEYGLRNASLDVTDLLNFINIPTLFDIKIPPKKKDGKKNR